MKAGRLLCLIAFAALAVVPIGTATPGTASPNDDARAGMRLGWSLPDGPTRTHSDIAFWGDVGVAGNYDGFRVFNKRTHQLYVSYLCRGPQDDPRDRPAADLRASLQRSGRLPRHHRLSRDPQGGGVLHERRADLGHQRPGEPRHASRDPRGPGLGLVLALGRVHLGRAVRGL